MKRAELQRKMKFDAPRYGNFMDNSSPTTPKTKETDKSFYLSSSKIFQKNDVDSFSTPIIK